MGTFFPGMDPYLERHWEDVHANLVTLTRTSLNRHLPDDLVARMEERVVIDSIHYDRPRAIYPDVRVYEDPNASFSDVNPSATASLATPVVLTFESEEHTETYVTISDADGGELVTVIEYLSPSNKLAGQGRDQYRRKRDELGEARVNVVEVDLIRRGDWRELLLPVIAPQRLETTYRVVTRRCGLPRSVDLYPIALRSRLPAIPIPLRATDPVVAVDLQEILAQAYVDGRYDRMNYRRACEPPLDSDDAAWAEDLLKSAGRT